jgi:IS30 family transposase
MEPTKQAGRWSSEDDANLKVMLKQGMTKRQIARVLGRPESSVHTRAEIVNKSTQQRKCMCCEKSFSSEGPHNRLCTSCRNKSFSPYAH